MTTTITRAQRTVNMPAPNLLKIAVGDTVREYRVEVWVAGPGVHTIELTRLDTNNTYTILIKDHRNPRCSHWTCDCPSARYKGGQCKHILALKAGLRSVGVRI